MRDGEVLVSFEPLFPGQRDGTGADAVLDLMRQVGFVFDEEPDFEVYRPSAAACALAETLTAVRVTPALLEGSTYLGGTAPVPGLRSRPGAPP